MAEPQPQAPMGTVKHDMLEELGERTLLLPSLVNEGLEANDQAKYLLTLLQAARAHADSPSSLAVSLRDERLVAGIDDAQFDTVVERARHVGPDTYLIPDVAKIHVALSAAVSRMLLPLAAAEEVGAPPASRLAALEAARPDLTGDVVPGRYVDRITSNRAEDGDSLHLLVMDAHRALNRLQARISSASIEGAAVYGLADGDDQLVDAFMDGVHRTSPLKFDHPGMATTATRVGNRLLIENDLGTTNAHVVVVAVEGLTVTVTYTDVHLRRLEFFQSMLETFAPRWSGPDHRQGGTRLGQHHVAVGRYDAEGPSALDAYLRHLGSRLVFVIDWNRARKRLRSLVGGDDAVSLLGWAADNELGHVAFLRLGGEQMVYDAVELATGAPARYGQALVDVLGRDATVALTRFALRAAAEGMLARKSTLLIRDELRVEALRYVRASHSRLLDVAAEHASLIVEAAELFRSAVVELGAADTAAFLARAARRASRWEHRADEILINQRQAAGRVATSETVAALTTIADDAIDALEEAIFTLSLLPAEAAAAVRPLLDPLALVVVMAAREYCKAVEVACQVVDGSAADDLEDFLVAVDHVSSLEHDADTADRLARADLVTSAPDFRSLYVADCVSRGAEEASDALLRSALGLRDHVLRLLSPPSRATVP